MSKVFSIAIDGPAGAGKSTVARKAAEALGAVYLDTGAMYRTIGLYMIRHGFETPEDIAAHAAAPQIGVSFQNGVQQMSLDGEDVSTEIRTPEASMGASKVAAIPEVRRRLVELQREIAERESIIMDGRDIGTHVLPNATLKIFLTASAEVRAQRRFLELQAAGKDESFEKVLNEIVQRDYNDSHRAASPMRQADDAVLVDSSEMTQQQVIDTIVAKAREAIGG